MKKSSPLPTPLLFQKLSINKGKGIYEKVKWNFYTCDIADSMIVSSGMGWAGWCFLRVAAL